MPVNDCGNHKYNSRNLNHLYLHSRTKRAVAESNRLKWFCRPSHNSFWQPPKYYSKNYKNKWLVKIFSALTMQSYKPITQSICVDRNIFQKNDYFRETHKYIYYMIHYKSLAVLKIISNFVTKDNSSDYLLNKNTNQ